MAKQASSVTPSRWQSLTGPSELPSASSSGDAMEMLYILHTCTQAHTSNEETVDKRESYSIEDVPSLFHTELS